MPHTKVLRRLFFRATVASLILAGCAGAPPSPTQPLAAPASPAAPQPTQPPPAERKVSTFIFTQEFDTLNYYYSNMWFSEITTQL